MKTRYIFQICVGILAAAAGVVLRLSGGTDDTALTSAFIAGGTALILMGISNHRRFGDGVDADERTRNIDGRTALWSWFATMIFLCALFWIDYFGVLLLDVQTAIVYIVLFMALTAAAFSWYFTHRMEGA